jgi:hypothetical protein
MLAVVCRLAVSPPMICTLPPRSTATTRDSGCGSRAATVVAVSARAGRDVGGKVGDPALEVVATLGVPDPLGFDCVAAWCRPDVHALSTTVAMTRVVVADTTRSGRSGARDWSRIPPPW